jgi:hypothetical protein
MRGFRLGAVCALWILAFVLSLLALPVQAQFTLATNNGAITIIRYIGTSAVVIIPSTTNGLPVTSIGQQAFVNSTSLRNVTVPNSISSIGDEVFYDCTGLTNVSLGNGLISIGGLAFYGCISLASVTVPTNVTSIGGEAFYDCTSLTNVTLGNNLSSIGGGAFEDCVSLRGVTIPKGVTVLADGVFDGCTGLTKATLGNNVTSIGSLTFGYCSSLLNITIPNSVTNVGDAAFQSCTGLKGVYFQGNAPGADSSVFAGDTNATSYYLPGTGGWGTFAAMTGVPAVLWNPRILPGASFGVQTNRFGFTITGTSNLVILVEACTNLANPTWSLVGTNTLTGGSSYFSDPPWRNYFSRFYRFRSP